MIEFLVNSIIQNTKNNFSSQNYAFFELYLFIKLYKFLFFDRLTTNRDVFNRLMACSDPLITLQSKITIKKKCDYSTKMKKLLVIKELPTDSQNE